MQHRAPRAPREHERLEEGVRGEAVRAMDSRAGHLAARVEPRNRSAPVQIGDDAAADVVRRGHHGNRIVEHVVPELENAARDVGKSPEQEALPQTREIQEHELVAAPLHLGVDGAGDHVPRGQLVQAVVAVHEGLPVRGQELCAFTAHRFRDEEGLGVRVEEARGMELDELEVRDGRARAERGRQPVPGRDVGIRRVEVRLSRTAGGEHGGARRERADRAAAPVEHVGSPDAVALRCPLSSREMLRFQDEIHHDVVLEDGDLGVLPHLIQERRLHGPAGAVLRVDDAPARMSPFLPEREGSRGLGVSVEAHPERDQVRDLSRALLHEHAHGFGVAETGAADQGVALVDLRPVVLAQRRRDSALRVVRVGLVSLALRHDQHAREPGRVERGRKPRDAAPDDQNVRFFLHRALHLGGPTATAARSGRRASSTGSSGLSPVRMTRTGRSRRRSRGQRGSSFSVIHTDSAPADLARRTAARSSGPRHRAWSGNAA